MTIVKEQLWDVLLQVHFPLLVFSPSDIHKCFEKAGVITSRLLTSRSVIDFLKTFRTPGVTCQIGNLPSPITQTNIKGKKQLNLILEYCKQDKEFSSLMDGLPLLLTADDQLRMFDSNDPVYRSKFSNLLPAHSCSFVHRQFVHILPRVDRTHVTTSDGQIYCRMFS